MATEGPRYWRVCARLQTELSRSNKKAGPLLERPGRIRSRSNEVPPSSWCNRRKSAARSTMRPASLCTRPVGQRGWRSSRACSAGAFWAGASGITSTSPPRYDHCIPSAAATAITSTVAPQPLQPLSHPPSTVAMVAVVPVATTIVAAAIALAATIAGGRRFAARGSRFTAHLLVTTVMPVSAAATAKQPASACDSRTTRTANTAANHQHHSHKISLHQKYLLGLTGNPISTHTSVPSVLIATQFATLRRDASTR